MKSIQKKQDLIKKKLIYWQNDRFHKYFGYKENFENFLWTKIFEA